MKYYARESGFGQQFESVVAGGLAEFCNRMENPQNALWTAVHDSEMFGSVAVDGEDIGDGTEVRAASSMIKLTRSARVGAIWAAAGPTGEPVEVPTGQAMPPTPDRPRAQSADNGMKPWGPGGACKMPDSRKQLSQPSPLTNCRNHFELDVWCTTRSRNTTRWKIGSSGHSCET